MSPPILEAFDYLLMWKVVEFTVDEDGLINVVGNNAREDVPVHVVLQGSSPDVVAEVKEWLSCLVLRVDVHYDGEHRKGVGIRLEVELVIGVQEFDYLSSDGAMDGIGRWS